MRLLELFSGTKSVSKAVGNLYDEIISVDIMNKNNPTFCVDILQWDYKQYPVGYFDAIWASPPCTEYSKAKTQGVRNIELANRIVTKTIEIIEYFNPYKWFIENPQTGLLKDQEFMLGIPFYDVDYCMYGLNYRKRTRIWTLIDTFEPKICNKDCGKIINGKHLLSCGNGNKKYSEISLSLNDKYRIPEQLVIDLFNST